MVSREEWDAALHEWEEARAEVVRLWREVSTRSTRAPDGLKLLPNDEALLSELDRAILREGRAKNEMARLRANF